MCNGPATMTYQSFAHLYAIMILQIPECVVNKRAFSCGCKISKRPYKAG